MGAERGAAVEEERLRQNVVVPGEVHVMGLGEEPRRGEVAADKRALDERAWVQDAHLPQPAGQNFCREEEREIQKASSSTSRRQSSIDTLALQSDVTPRNSGAFTWWRRPAWVRSWKARLN